VRVLQPASFVCSFGLGFEFNASIWKFFEVINLERLAYAKDEIRLVQKLGWAEPEVTNFVVGNISTIVGDASLFFQCIWTTRLVILAA
jgi:hypothetical protein